MANILIVEDDKDIVTNLAAFLRSEGFSADSAAEPGGAVRKMKEQQFDLLLLDVSLQNGNGFALCREIREYSDMPIIFLTASGDEFSVVTGFELGADDYINKPFRPRELVSRIDPLLGRGMERDGRGAGITQGRKRRAAAWYRLNSPLAVPARPVSPLPPFLRASAVC